MKSILPFLVLVCCWGHRLPAQLYTEYLEYTVSSDVEAFVQRMFASPQVEIFNAEFVGTTTPYQSGWAIKNIGFFDATRSTVGIDSGIIMTGGFLDPPYGLGRPASEDALYQNWGTSDSILNSLTSSYMPVVGAAVLEFDFIPNGDTIKFSYVFASDEYPCQVCHIDNDIFAFHISGPGITGLQNMAVIPGTNIQVGNNSINDLSICPAGHPTTLCQTVDYPHLYVDHAGDSTFIFNGSSTILTAQYATVPCDTYRLRLAIAEGGGTPSENAAVFLEAHSFNSEPLKIESSVSYGGEDTVLYEGCGYAEIVFRRTYDIQKSKTLSLSVGGSAVGGAGLQPLARFGDHDSGQHVRHLVDLSDCRFCDG